MSGVGSKAERVMPSGLKIPVETTSANERPAARSIAIPSVVVGGSILFAYLIIPIPVYNTIWILLIAYVTMYLPYGMRFASGGIAQIHRELEEAAQTSGAGTWQVLRRVLAPLLAPVLIAGWLYVFVLAVRELAASIFLAHRSAAALVRCDRFRTTPRRLTWAS